MRVGIGIDVHPFSKNRPLILGGVLIPSDLGLDGHSDADVLTHAICDALLGAAGLGDIGKLYPNTDSAFKNISSLILLANIKKKLTDARYTILNIDTMILAEKPLISPYIEKMKKKLSQALKTREDIISIKATTSEKLGYVGREEGIVAHAICAIMHTREQK